MGLTDKIKEKYGDDNDSTPTPDNDPYSGGGDMPMECGDYVAEILPDYTTTQKTNQNKPKPEGEMAKVQFKILGPKYENRHVFENYNFDCPGAKDEDYEDEQLDKLLWLAACCDVDNFSDVKQLHGGKCIITTGLERDEYKGEISYDPCIWGVKHVSEGPAEGPRGDQPDIWHEAYEYRKNGEDPKKGGGSTDNQASGGNNQSSYDDSEIPF